MFKSVLRCAFAAATAVVISTAVYAAELPASTKSYLKQIKLSEDVMRDEDADLGIPKEWLDGAIKEGAVSILGEWTQKQFATLSAPFKERYPAIKITYNEATTINQRAVAPLVAFKQHQYIADIITGFGGAAPEFKEASALEDVSMLPGFRNQLEGANDPEGKWAAIRLRYWCMGYNTKLVKKEDLPATWDDLLTNKIWQNGNLAIGNRPQLWLLMLRSVKTGEWTEDYAKTLFTVVKPQFRNEGMSALIGLLASGEFRAAIPVAADSIKEFSKSGAPVGWHCPEPVPYAATQIGILSGNPHPNAARVWTNWMLSREAQLAQFVADSGPPPHKALQLPEFIPYAEEVRGHQLAEGDEQYKREVFKVWQQYWK
jgi:iron(III) transport system substrate-binding protein